MSKRTDESFCPKNQDEWRNWLQKHHQTKDGIWLIIHKKKSQTPNLNWSQAVDEALCFGWIDSTKKSIDSEKYQQYFAKRKSNSTWSKVNKDKIVRLMDLNLMQFEGLKSIEKAKENGSWSILDSVENLEIPEDLKDALDKNPKYKAHFINLSKSSKKMILASLVLAKRPETRLNRIQKLIIDFNLSL